MNNFLDDIKDISYDMLKNLDNIVHDKNELEIVDNFIHELEDSITKSNSERFLDDISIYTCLNFARFEDDYAVCFDYNDKDIYFIPKDKIAGNMPEIGEVLKKDQNNNFYVDYTGIPISEEDVEKYMEECKIKRINSRVDDRFIVEEINEDYIGCVNQFTSEKENLPADDINEDIKIGDILIFKAGKWKKI